MIQFSFAFGVKRRPGKHREDFKETIMDYVFGTEIWSLLLVFIVQDFPFLIVRCIIMIKYELESNYTLYYLFGKNLILCTLEIYRVIVIIIEKRVEDTKIEPEEEIEKKSNVVEKFESKTEIIENPRKNDVKSKKSLTPKPDLKLENI